MIFLSSRREAGIGRLLPITAIPFAVALLCGADGRPQDVRARGMTLHASAAKSAGKKRQAKAADRFEKGSAVTVKTRTKTALSKLLQTVERQTGNRITVVDKFGQEDEAILARKVAVAIV